MMYKSILLFAALFCASYTFAQTTYDVEVGGGMNPPPYFSPQFFSIQQGDIVVWTSVGGTHNIDGTQTTFPDNPESFSYALTNGANSNVWNYSFTFNTPGVYNYECSMWDHNETQFGTITVMEATTITKEKSITSFVFPNPANDQITINNKGTVFIYNNLGELVFTTVNNPIDISTLGSGIYLLKTEEITEKFIKQ